MTLTSPSTLISAGPVLFAPETGADGGAVLFAADVARATIVALELPAEGASGTADASGAAGTSDTSGGDVDLDHLGAKLASLLGVDPEDAVIRGLAVHPVSHDVYLSVSRGRGAQAEAALVRVDARHDLTVVDVDALEKTEFALDDAPAADDERMDVWLDGTDSGSAPREFNGVRLDIAQVPAQRSTVTGLAWVGGTLVVAGLSNEEFSSRLRRISYPFDSAATETSVEIFHVDHGKYETQSPIRALTSFDGGAGILATYTCTPVVAFTLDDLDKGGLVRGRTVAELGPMNQPFSLVSYDRDGEEFLLVSNTRHPLLKIAASSVADQDALHVPVSDEHASMGVPRDELTPEGVTWMANLDRERIVVVQQVDGDTHLRTLHAADL